jgi:dihydrofolate synthase/folylpolyglutamate synthase
MVERRTEDSHSTYNETVEWLFGLHRFGSKPGLTNVRHLLGRMGDPHKNFKAIHVTGTNGKGTTTAMITSILRAADYKVGMFISPHLSSFTERITINGERIQPEVVVDIIEGMKSIIDEMVENPELRHPTFFEVITAIAFKHFSEQEVDFAILEVGMGGRLDATNVVQALISVITNVSLEHTYVLGNSVLEIAEKKAGIIKKGGVLITATQDDEVYKLFSTVCEKVGSRIFRVGKDLKFNRLTRDLEGQIFHLDGISRHYDRLFIPLLGKHQLLNAASAVGAVEALNYRGIEIPVKAFHEGLRSVKWPGRLEVVQENPLVVIDGAKDVEATRAIKESLLEDFQYPRRVAVVSISSDKNIPEMIGHLTQAVDSFIITAHSVMGRAAEPETIGSEIEKRSKPYRIETDIKKAIKGAIDITGEDGMVLIVGSVFLVGEAREIWYKPETSDPV